MTIELSASAARRYKQITGGMTEALNRMRAEDAERAEQLARRLVELREAMESAAEREALTVLGVALQWEAALEELWHEHWMTLSPRPQPDPTALPRDLDRWDAAVAKSYTALREAVRRRPLLGRR